MIVDFHTHCFPDALAPRAMAALSRNAATLGMNPFTDATLSDNEAHLMRAGVTHFVVCNIATNPRQQTNVNSFAIELTKLGDHIHPLGSLHPDGEDFEREILRLKSAGIKGLKLHPDYVGVEVDDPRFMRLFELCERNGLFAVIHAGFDPVSPGHMHAPPRAIGKVLERFPALTLIAAHMGGPLVAREVLEVLVGTTVDTAPKAEPRHPVNDTTTAKFANLQFGRNYDPNHK